ncbi:D-alanyl-D-alanine carboxypeptidase/D-alanyl-D-alanine-endopeptidase [Streptomyces agglomeratus]|uniref:D-alanyl-D-alanine carboxypeptidase/D-alanyl-D-alanine endopeptidase n=1 Tax=Streptomyces agglomeratus TaxID=285458 RepID=UPI000854AAE9|nr:D-alanyl-D-alanine carboxypeptidase/D-alanyl-D-alanine-endopeptidase [Streptomyces agglomeratus]OEJ40247.1 D-alanyl-D-alanine carboxypeptidase/D-alanyl-D-alanine-endopeptidase [Streptomyces agglomeratus]OEJ45374.1 D-alanyl-D-alanine carboxypeptidase/D-alanyl-D-alanine-endopeptidase [Streptomyces agglomeratus]
MSRPVNRAKRPASRRTRAWAAPAAVVLACTLIWSSSATTVAGPSDTGLKGAIDTILTDPRLDGGAASVVVADAATGETLYQRDSGDRLMPASNTKLPTSAAAMAILGPDYRFRTDALSTGTRQGSLLRGNLYLRGSGDPTTLAADYDALAAEVAASGIKRVTGRLIADDTRFDSQRLGRSWAADDESSYYSAQISALTVAPDTDYDAGSVIVSVAPGTRPGAAPRLTLTPPTDYVDLDIRATTVPAGRPNTLGIEREHGSNTISITGNVPLDASATKEWVTVWEPTGYAAAVFADALAAHGVRVTGGPARLGRPTPAGAAPLATHTSMPLKELVRPFMKLSNNMHAEALTKAIGHETAGSGTWSAGLAGISGYLKKEGLDTAALRQVDGSGLSRMNNIPAAEFVKLLLAVRDAPWYADWYESLPVACAPDRAIGGTLRSRMCRTPAALNARAKTGTLTGASGLSGYVTDAGGRKLVFSIVLNNHLAASVKSIEDAIVTTLAASTGTTTRLVRPPTPRAATSGTDSAPALECSWRKPSRC